jgi:hypothetical protein
MVRATLLVAAVAASLFSLACGGSDSNNERPAGGISTHDQRVIARIQTDRRAWKKAAAPWVKAFFSKDPDRFLAVHRRSLRALGSAARGVELGSRQIADRSLRQLVAPIGRANRSEFDAMVDIGDGAQAFDLQAIRKAGRKLRHASRRKATLTARLVARFPELGRGF